MVEQRVAIVHEWLITLGGSEKVLVELLAMFPEADLFAVVDFLPAEHRAGLRGKSVKTSFIQCLPFAARRYKAYLPLMPIAVEQFDLSSYNLVISSSHAVAKGVLTGPNQTHICYCHSPMRYAWDLQYQYLRESGFTRGIKSHLARLVLHYLRIWDVRSAAGVDLFIANSAYIARRIRKAYRREAVVVYPPVDVEAFSLQNHKENFYVTASRMVSYKRIDIIIEAFAKMPGRRLVVIGDGPDREKLRALGAENITFLGYQNDTVLKSHLQRARGFVFAAEEDFGILPVEAQACGTPVIAYAAGGALETVLPAGNSLGLPATGVFFAEQTPAAVCAAVTRFESLRFDPQNCRAWAERFSRMAFAEAMRAQIMAMLPAAPISARPVSVKSTNRYDVDLAG
ncbi:MAG: glycosyltransferase family 4 protein [Rhodospirillales bacterium]|nr:glycosyltransferase family 4 protein [Rhodospirillales bacterium]